MQQVLLATAFLMLCCTVVQAQPVQVEGVRLGVALDHTRVVLDLDRRARFERYLITPDASRGYRLVVVLYDMEQPKATVSESAPLTTPRSTPKVAVTADPSRANQGLGSGSPKRSPGETVAQMQPAAASQLPPVASPGSRGKATTRTTQPSRKTPAPTEGTEAPTGVALASMEVEFGTEFLFELEENFDLDDQDPGEDATVVEFPLNVKFTFNPTSYLQGVVGFELNREIAISEEEKEEKVTELILKETYISIENLLDGYTFRVGRQKFRDDREWLFGGRRGLFLDGVLLHYAGGKSTPLLERPKLNVNFSVNREEIVARDLLNPDRRKAARINNYFLSTEWNVNDRFMVGGHLLFRDDLEKEQTRSLFLAVTSRGQIIDNVSYWAAFSHVRGEDQATQLSGFGFDLGATVSLGLPVGPYFTVGYAFGSGDDNPDDDTDKTNRQTGLHANQDRFGGVIDFNYYGEAFDPELSNIHILTAGVGVTPTENTSIDVVYHVYRQDILAGELRRVGVDADLNDPPRSKRLGSAVDVIAGWTDILDLEMAMEFKLGYFFPGSAYPDDAHDDAFFVVFEFEYEF